MRHANKAAIALLVGAACAFPASALATPEDFATGAFKTSIFGGLKGSFTAHGTPLSAHGQIHFDQDIPGSPFSQLTGTVDCAFVHGNSATITGRLTSGGGGNTFFQLGVTDNGGPSQAVPDAFNLFLTPFELRCNFPLDGVLAIEQGNIIVNDNTP